MGVKRETLNNIKELKRLKGMANLNQKDVASYLGITRQSLSKIYNGDLVNTSKSVQENLDRLCNKEGDLDLTRAVQIIKLTLTYKSMLNKLNDIDKTEIEHIRDILKYINYWIKEKEADDYMFKLSCHIQNFHLKSNPYYLYFREYFHKDLAPLLTFDIDYNDNFVRNITFGNIVKNDYLKKGYDLQYQINWDNQNKKELSFENFIDSLQKFYNGKLRYNIFIDHIDSSLDYINDNVTKKYKEKLKKIYFNDISRIFNILNESQPIEEVLSNYIPSSDLDKDKVLNDAGYRNRKIIKLIRIVSGYDISKKISLETLMKSSDSEIYNKDQEISRKILHRRKMKMK